MRLDSHAPSAGQNETQAFYGLILRSLPMVRIRRDSAANSQQSGIGTLVECQEPRWGTNISKKSTKAQAEPGKNAPDAPSKPQEPRRMVAQPKPKRMDKHRRIASYPKPKPGAEHYGR